MVRELVTVRGVGLGLGFGVQGLGLWDVGSRV